MSCSQSRQVSDSFPTSLRARVVRTSLRRPRGRILAVRWGLNPNSSSLGVDITFLLFGLSIITLLTPILGFFLRFSRQRS
jgi:hypothetical protein